jgi:hypothetical protein
MAAVSRIPVLALSAALAVVGCSGESAGDSAPPGTTAPTTRRLEPPPPAAAGRGRTYTVDQVEQRLGTVTRLPVVRYAEASTPDVTSLRTRPHGTDRFGEFQLFVFRPAAAKRMTRVFTQAVRPDERGIYWVPDQAGGWIAVTLHGRNLALGWFPTSYGSKAVDARWARLQAAVAKIL